MYVTRIDVNCRGVYRPISHYTLKRRKIKAFGIVSRKRSENRERDNMGVSVPVKMQTCAAGVPEYFGPAEFFNRAEADSGRHLAASPSAGRK
jgi:hypothetical protein